MKTTKPTKVIAIKEHDVVTLQEDLINPPLKRGKIGTVVFAYSHGYTYEVEFTKDNKKIVVVTLGKDQIKLKKK